MLLAGNLGYRQSRQQSVRYSKTDVTYHLARKMVEVTFEDIPTPVIEEGKRALLNWLGVAIGASCHPSIDMILSLSEEVGGRRQASLLGRKEKSNILFGALINGMSSNIFDFDDTYLETLLHPSSPVAPVVFALGERYNLIGREILTAFILGLEVECRISRSVHPDHYRTGWHITSTVGNFGAAVAAGKLLNLNAKQMAYALGIAATQASGIREMFGTMTKPFHSGKAAMNGIIAAILAEKGFMSSLYGIEGESGFLKVLSTKQDCSEITDKIGERWEILKNTYKPFACGIVIHPIIDGVLKLREENGLKPGEVVKIDAFVNKLVQVMAGNKEPKNGLESKLSAYHCAAVGLLDGRGGEEQFSDTKVFNKNLISLRNRVTLTVIPRIEVDEAIIKITLKNGKVLRKHIKHAVGSKDNPMSDEALRRKFYELTKTILPQKQIGKLIALLSDLENVKSVKKLVRLCSNSLLIKECMKGEERC